VAGQRLSSIQVNAAKIPEGSSRTVNVQLLAPSEFAFVSAAGAGTGGALSEATTLQVRGNNGTEVLSFASGSSLDQIATAINAATELTGVSATVSGGSVYFTSDSFGSNSLVSVERLTGSLTLTGGGASAEDFGVDGQVTVNGTNANVDGLKVSARSGSLSVDLILSSDFAQTLATATAADRTATFDITGGGAVFAIAPTLGLVGQEALGLQGTSTGSLGNGVVGFLASLGQGEANDLSSKNFATAQRIIRESIAEVSSTRGRIGTFQKDTLTSTINSLQVTLENTTAAESAIRDADFAVETSSLTRSQILVQSATVALQLANSQPQNALALLG
jgi:flagellin